MIIMMLIITNLTSTKSKPTLKIGMRHLPKKKNARFVSLKALQK